MPSFCSSRLKYSSSIGGRHPIFKTVLISSFPTGRLECSFHFFIYLKLIDSALLIKGVQR